METAGFSRTGRPGAVVILQTLNLVCWLYHIRRRVCKLARISRGGHFERRFYGLPDSTASSRPDVKRTITGLRAGVNSDFQGKHRLAASA